MTAPHHEPNLNPSGHRLVVPGLGAAAIAVLLPAKPTSAAEGLAADGPDVSLLDLTPARLAEPATQLDLVRLAAGVTAWLLLIVGSSIAIVMIRVPAQPVTLIMVRHIALAASELVVLTVGIALTVSCRGAVIAAVVGAVALIAAVVAILMLEWMWPMIAAEGGVLGHAAPSLLGGLVAGAGLGGLAADFDERARTADGHPAPLSGRLWDVIDVALVICVLAAISYGSARVVSQALTSITSESVAKVFTHPVETFLGLLLGGPLLVAVWRKLMFMPSAGRTPKIVSRLAIGISLLGAAAANVTADQDANSVKYALGIGVLAGGLTAGLFSLIWQWSDGWQDRSRRALAVLVATGCTVITLTAFGLFNSNYNRELSLLYFGIIFGSLTGYPAVILVRKTAPPWE